MLDMGKREWTRLDLCAICSMSRRYKNSSITSIINMYCDDVAFNKSGRDQVKDGVQITMSNETTTT